MLRQVRMSGSMILLRSSRFDLNVRSGPSASPPPWHGSSLALFVCGGAQRGISLATGFFTGESRRNPLRGSRSGKVQDISGLANHDLAKLDSFAEARESSLRKPLGGSHPNRKPPLQCDNPWSESAAPIERGTCIGKIRPDRCTCPTVPPAGPSCRR